MGNTDTATIPKTTFSKLCFTHSLFPKKYPIEVMPVTHKIAPIIQKVIYFV